ncbi:Glutathione gamma-glutamylcysteinyltransferase 1 [Hibiscus syriacus]|uniref:glutathione gamma-glutamylcysteinyltransferase n=1 Tax=Hibiscus syriacus TaxID=106335 RepID=A0A6A3A8T3_HIBSY|nr:Glutathione gamma-glutamylcysteinyltransferase 1 [Hibiscus syriacus]
MKMAMAGLYKRVLPSPPAVDFASSDGKQLFIEAIQNGTMEGFYRLISYFQTQSEPAYCGLASLSMVLNALAIDPGRKWKGPWRWFDESMLDCCEPLEKVKEKGISFGKLVCLAHCAGAKVEAFRTNQSSLDDFRKFVTGTGHFSPIGGYHAGSDMALILDVARFKYPPHWVPLKLLWEAMENVDEATGQRRGFLLISRPHRDPGLLYTLVLATCVQFYLVQLHLFWMADPCACTPSLILLLKVMAQSCKHESWVKVAKYLMDDVPNLVKSDDVKDVQKVISVVSSSLPSNFEEFIKWVAEVRRREDGDQNLSLEEKGRLSLKEAVLKQVQETGLFKHVVEFLSSVTLCCRNTPASSHENNLPDIAATVCCQGAELLSGKFGSPERYCCRETSITSLKANGDKPITLVSGTVVNGRSEQGVDVLVPSCSNKLNCCGCSPTNCIGIYPAGNDVLTALLLALPPETWHGIKDEKLLSEMSSLVSTENLPILLQEEVLHLRRQLHLLKKCQENKVDDDLGEPLC